MNRTATGSPAMNLTDSEMTILGLSMNYPNDEAQLADNHNNGAIRDLWRAGFGKHEADGVLGSLVDKGMIKMEEFKTLTLRYGTNFTEIYRAGLAGWDITEYGIRAFFAHPENGKFNRA